MEARVQISLFQILQIIFWLLSLVGIVIAWRTFRQNARIRRAEWLRSLFEKFYETDHYRQIRSIMDNGRIESEVAGNEQLDDKLVDYLNFFEFIASLWKLKQLSLQEVLLLFDYWLGLIKGSNYLDAYLKKYGFENLALLLTRI
ncbi:MAG: hypothetical protein C5B59_18190 [Bacteroidetes bacterium]|nr:MAG: hypothetical protein C5B59_18190 [Bacteroidota bacterium]